MAQVSEGFSYQSVVRDASGNLLNNQLIGLRMTLLANSALGTADYVETHQVATNGYGVVSISVGSGTVVSGVFNNVDWINNTYFLKTELDISGGTNYVFMGISQILAVPYALHAQTASSVLGDNDTSATNEIQQLSIVGNQLVLDNGGNSVTLSGTIDLDADPTNELQALNISNDTLYLSQGNYVLIDDYLQSLSNTAGTISISGNNTISLADSSATNEIQTLSSTAGTISLSSANTIVLADSSATNELQTLSQTAGSISLSNGNTIMLQDSSSVNELQTLSNTPGTITISDGNTITLADSSATNELQVLTNTAGTITISDGNTITITDSSITNELQNLSVSNDTLLISSGNAVKLPIPNVPVEVPPGTIVWSESANDTALLNRNFDLIGQEVKNYFEIVPSSNSNDTNSRGIIHNISLHWPLINFTSNNNFEKNSFLINSHYDGNKLHDNWEVRRYKTSFYYYYDLVNDKIVFMTNQFISLFNLGDNTKEVFDNTFQFDNATSFCYCDSNLYAFGGSFQSVGVGATIIYSNSLYRYNLLNNSWILVSTANQLSYRVHVNSKCLNNKIYLYGGIKPISGATSGNSSSLQDCEYADDGAVYDIQSNTWLTIPSHNNRSLVGSINNVMVPTSNKLIVWGGYGGTSNDRLSDLIPFSSSQQISLGKKDGIIYDFQTNTWTSMATNSSTYMGSSTSTIHEPTYFMSGDELIFFGGYMINQYGGPASLQGLFFKYNLINDSWQTISLPNNVPSWLYSMVIPGAYYDGEKLTIITPFKTNQNSSDPRYFFAKNYFPSNDTWEDLDLNKLNRDHIYQDYRNGNAFSQTLILKNGSEYFFISKNNYNSNNPPSSYDYIDLFKYKNESLVGYDYSSSNSELRKIYYMYKKL